MGVEPGGGVVVSLPVLILVWLGGNAALGLGALLYGWMLRRGAPSETVYIYPPEYDYMEKVREEER